MWLLASENMSFNSAEMWASHQKKIKLLHFYNLVRWGCSVNSLHMTAPFWSDYIRQIIMYSHFCVSCLLTLKIVQWVLYSQVGSAFLCLDISWIIWGKKKYGCYVFKEKPVAFLTVNTVKSPKAFGFVELWPHTLLILQLAKLFLFPRALA